MKPLALPQDIIDCLEFFTDSDRGQVYSALFAYIASGKLPGDEMSPAARGAFEFARRRIDGLLERRRRAAAKRIEASVAPLEKTVDERDDETSDVPAAHIREMRRVVDIAFKTISNKARRDEKIRYELNRRFPGLYSGILYDGRGTVILKPAS